MHPLSNNNSNDHKPEGTTMPHSDVAVIPVTKPIPKPRSIKLPIQKSKFEAPLTNVLTAVAISNFVSLQRLPKGEEKAILDYSLDDSITNKEKVLSDFSVDDEITSDTKVITNFSVDDLHTSNQKNTQIGGQNKKKNRKKSSKRVETCSYQREKGHRKQKGWEKW